jgi:hypothetical protein
MDYIRKQALKITMGNLKKWTAFSSDTNNTQRKCWKLIAQEPDLSHVHSIPYDSHGLQLSIKDLLWPGKDRFNQQITTQIGSFWKEGPNALVSFFQSSEKQLAFLREVIKNTFGKARALIVTVPTRWGTQVRQVKSILNSQVPLKGYALIPYAADTWKGTLSSPTFWQNLSGLHQALKPIHAFQKMSESNASGLNKVYPRWIQLNSHMQRFRQEGSGPWWKDINEYCNRVGQGG